MPDFCTCGARLPEDARFCHKCGKPQREEPLLVEEAPEPQPAAPPPPAAPAFSLRNAVAVRAALPAAVLAFALQFIAGPAGLVALFGAGFFAVYLYRRWTGQSLSMLNGARLGWLAGVFIFVILAAAAGMMIVALSQPEVFQQAREQVAKRYPLSDDDITQALEQLRTPAGVAATMLVLFLSSTLLPAFGGAVGAKFLDRG